MYFVDYWPEGETGAVPSGEFRKLETAVGQARSIKALLPRAGASVKDKHGYLVYVADLAPFSNEVTP